MRELRRNTATTVRIGPFVIPAGTNYGTPSASVTNAKVKLSVNDGPFAVRTGVTAACAAADNHVAVGLGAEDVNSSGRCRIMILDVVTLGVLPCWEDFMVLPESIYDAKYGTASNQSTTSLSLISMSIANPSGDALTISSTSGIAANISGQSGIVTTGTAGPGLKTAGTTQGMYATASAGPGLQSSGAGGASPGALFNGTSGPGMSITGTTYGMYVTASAGTAGYFNASGSVGDGIYAVGSSNTSNAAAALRLDAKGIGNAINMTSPAGGGEVIKIVNSGSLAAMSISAVTASAVVEILGTNAACGIKSVAKAGAGGVGLYVSGGTAGFKAFNTATGPDISSKEIDAIVAKLPNDFIMGSKDVAERATKIDAMAASQSTDMSVVASNVVSIKSVTDALGPKLPANKIMGSSTTANQDTVLATAASIATLSTSVASVNTAVSGVQSDITSIRTRLPATVVASQADVLAVPSGTKTIDINCPFGLLIPAQGQNKFYKLSIAFRGSDGAQKTPDGAFKINVKDTETGVDLDTTRLFKDKAGATPLVVVGGGYYTVPIESVGLGAVYVKVSGNTISTQLQFTVSVTDLSKEYIGVRVESVYDNDFGVELSNSVATKTVIAEAIRDINVSASTPSTGSVMKTVIDNSSDLRTINGTLLADAVLPLAGINILANGRPGIDIEAIGYNGIGIRVSAQDDYIYGRAKGVNPVNGINVRSIDNRDVSALPDSIGTIVKGVVSSNMSNRGFKANVGADIATNGRYIGRSLIMTSGPLKNAAASIEDYVVAGSTAQFFLTELLGVPTVNDTFIVI